MAYLLDTNVLSELRKGARCDPHVQVWAESVAGQRHYVSVLSLGEIRKGIELLRRHSPSQCKTFERWLNHLESDYADSILPVTEAVADAWGRLNALRPLPVIDALIAATAIEHGLTVATRNVDDYKPTGVPWVNPFC